MLQDYVWVRFLRGKCSFLVVDYVWHADGLVVQDTLRYWLRLSGILDIVNDLLALATTKATIHMDGSGGVTEALACLLAGVAQACSAPAMVFLPLVAHVCAFLALI